MSNERERTTQVPVSLIESLHAEPAISAYNKAVLRALLSQPSAAEPTGEISLREAMSMVDLRIRPEPPSIPDMAPGTTFTGRHADPEECGGVDHRWFLLAGRRIVVSDHGQRWSVDSIDPSTIRDVTPPATSD